MKNWLKKHLEIVSSVFIIGTFSVLSSISFSQEIEKGKYLFVETAGTQNAHVITIPEHEVIKTFEVEPQLYDILGSKDGKELYINHGVGERGGGVFPHSSVIVARDIHSLDVLWRVEIPEGWAHHSSLSHDGNYLYTPIFDRPYTKVIDLERGEAAGKIRGEHGGHTSGLSADGERLFIGSIFTEAFIIQDVDSGEQIGRIQLDEGLRNFAYPKDESVVYQQLSGFHGFVILDPQKRKIVRRVPHPKPDQDYPDWTKRWPYKVDNGVAMSPDENYVVFAASAFDKVLIYSHPGAGFVTEIPTGENPSWVLISDDSKYAYITCQGSNEVSVISLETMEEIERIALPGKMPSRMDIIDVAAP